MNRLTKMDRRGFYTNKATCRNIQSSDGDWFKGVYFRSRFLAIDGEPIEKLGKLEDIEKELGIEIVGDTKVKIAIEETEEPWDDIFDDVDDNTEKEIEDNIDPNYIKEEK